LKRAVAFVAVLGTSAGCASLLGLDGDFAESPDATTLDAANAETSSPPHVDGSTCDPETTPCGQETLFCSPAGLGAPVGRLCQAGLACVNVNNNVRCLACTAALPYLPCGPLPASCGDNPSFFGQKCEEAEKVCQGPPGQIPSCTCRTSAAVPCGSSIRCDGESVTGTMCVDGGFCQFNACVSCDPAASACGTKTSIGCPGGAQDGTMCSGTTQCCTAGGNRGKCLAVAGLCL
jgi:hypothetical protein